VIAMPRLMLAAVFLFACSAPARAQGSLERLKLSLGDRVDVTERSGVITTGVLTDVTATAVQAGNRDFPIDSVLKVERRGDSVWDGLLIGAGIGLILSPIAQEGCLSGSKIPCVLGPMAVYGGIGALIDLGHEGKTTIYRAAPGGSKGARVAPIVAPGAGGLAVAIGF
jgi:hypothetical protein